MVTRARRVGGQRVAGGAGGGRCTAPAAGGGFSLVEMLVALVISSTLLAASLQALDALFKSYQATSESASTHVVARLITHRVMAMIRTGTDFGPYPADVLDSAQNPLHSSFVEFVSYYDPATGELHISRLEQRDQTSYTVGQRQYELRGPHSLWLVVEKQTPGGTVTEERPLLDGVESLQFTLEYDIGPRLRRATMDLHVRTGGDVYYTDEGGDVVQAKAAMGLFPDQPVLRFVASASPRRLR